MAAMPPTRTVRTAVHVAARRDVFILQSEMTNAVRLEDALQLPTEQIGARAQREILVAHDVQRGEHVACSRPREEIGEQRMDERRSITSRHERYVQLGFAGLSS